MTSRSPFFSRIFGFIAAVGIVTATSSFTSSTAEAGPFSFLFGGGGGGGSWSGTSGRSVVPFSKSYGRGTIVVSFSDRRLYFISNPGQAISYPIGTPAGKAKWSGTMRISSKRVNPGWTPTASMRRENPTLPAHVPGGHPRNPLGPRALYLGSSLYRIHGTDAPWTVGREVSHGCVRLYNRDIIDLYSRARVGAKVIVTWKRFG